MAKGAKNLTKDAEVVSTKEEKSTFLAEIASAKDFTELKAIILKLDAGERKVADKVIAKKYEELTSL